MATLSCLLSSTYAVNTTSTVTIPDDLSTHTLLKNAYGYSFEPGTSTDYFSNDYTTTLLGLIASKVGLPAPIRVGGDSADLTFFHADQTEAYIAYPNKTYVDYFNISAGYFALWKDYFPTGTELLYTLNYGYDEDGFANALAEAQGAIEGLGSNLVAFELGNELDHYISEGYRKSGWDCAELVPSWFNFTYSMTNSSWYKDAASPPKMQAAVFADPPWVPSQQVEADDFDVINVTKAGMVDESLISSYSMHLYPQSTCDTARWYRMSLDLLQNHTVLWLNVSQYMYESTAATGAGAPLVFGETNSVSCGGRSGISDTFGAALWSLDYVLLSATLGIEKVYFHLGSQSQYSAFTPEPYTLQGESLTAGIRANFFSHWFFAWALADYSSNSTSSSSSGNRTSTPSLEAYDIAPLSSANESSFSGYALFNPTSGELSRFVLLDTTPFNSSVNVSNPSTLSVTDSTSSTAGERPVRTVELDTSLMWTEGDEVRVIRLSAAGSNSKTGVSVEGVSIEFDAASGEAVTTGIERDAEVLSVGSDGTVTVEMSAAEAIAVVLL